MSMMELLWEAITSGCGRGSVALEPKAVAEATAAVTRRACTAFFGGCGDIPQCNCFKLELSLPQHALNDAPAAPPDLAAKALIPTPGADVADTIKQSVLAKNMLITAENADRAAAWADRIREKADLIVGALQLSMRASAPGRLRALERAHARAAQCSEHCSR